MFALHFLLVCFSQVIHVVLMGWLCYALILHAPRDKFHVLVFIFGMGYLCIMHIYRQYYDYGGYSLDITGFVLCLLQYNIYKLLTTNNIRKTLSSSWILHTSCLSRAVIRFSHSFNGFYALKFIDVLKSKRGFPWNQLENTPTHHHDTLAFLI